MKKLYRSNKDESARMFKSDFLEMFSKVHFSVPLFLYIPVVSYFLYQSFLAPEIGIWNGLGLFVLGLFCWTVTEYFLHRFIFHYELKGKIGERIHFIFHGVHHDYPNDSKRLVMPPVVSIPLAFLFYFLFKWILGAIFIQAFFPGFVAGYLFYDMLHYAVHHANWDNKLFIKLKTHHLKHHFKEPEKGYGVSSPLWDWVIGSDFKK